MAPIDIVIVIVVLVSALIGIARGLAREVLSLATWLAALVLALYFAPPLAERLTGLLADQYVRLVVAFIVIFLATLTAGGVLQWLARSLITSTGLTGTDRFLGFLFGAARGVVASLVVLIALDRFASTGQWWESSVLVPELMAFEGDVLTLMGKAEDWVVKLGDRG